MAEWEELQEKFNISKKTSKSIKFLLVFIIHSQIYKQLKY